MRRPVLVALALVALALAGCTGGDESPQERQRAQGWAQERASHGAIGVAATFDLRGSPMALRGDAAPLDLAAPFDLDVRPALGGASFVYFPDASVAGRRGLAVFEGARLHAASGTLGRLAVAGADIGDAVALRPAEDLGRGGPQGRFPEDWRAANESALAARAAVGQALALGLSGFSRGVLLTDAGAVPLTGEVTLDAPRLHWAAGSTVRVAAATLALPRFALGGSVASGSLEPEGRAPVPAPAGVFGRDAALRLEPGRARTEGPFRLTQALTASGPVLPAQVEVAPSAGEVRVAQGNATWLRVQVREAGFVGDAVFASVRAEGSGGSLVDLPLKRPPLLIEQLFEAVNATPMPGTPFAMLAVLLLSPGVILADALLLLTCVFAECPQQHPYPTWMDAGHLGHFYVRVRGDASPGAYDATLTIEGRNHPPVRIPVRVTVT